MIVVVCSVLSNRCSSCLDASDIYAQIQFFLHVETLSVLDGKIRMLKDAEVFSEVRR
jgi:hypothetical protein